MTALQTTRAKMGHDPRLPPGTALGRWIVALGLVLLVAGAARAAEKWWVEAPLNVDVHKHAFNRITANNVGCVVRFRLYFAVSEKQYQDADNEVRNHYRFKAEVRLDDKKVYSPEFMNSEPGRRVYEFSYDTDPEGCWADKKHKVWKVDVNGCRGSRCRIEPFE